MNYIILLEIGRKASAYPTLIVLFTIFYTQMYGQDSGDSPQETSSVPAIELQLQSQRWVLQKIVEAKGDGLLDRSNASINACNSDDYLQFLGGNTYHIYEGKRFCTEEKIELVGKGTWEMLSDSSFEDRYQEGRRIEKRIVEISASGMILTYEGQGGNQISLSYVSQEALENPDTLITEEIANIESKTSQENAVDDYRAQLEDLFRNILLETNRYTLMTLVELEEGRMPEVSEEDALYKKKVLLIPFFDSYNKPEKGSLDDLHKNLPILLLQQAGIDYLVSGNLENIEKGLKNNGPVVELVYSIWIWEAQSGEILHTESFIAKHNGALKNAIGKIALGTLETATRIAEVTSSDVSRRQASETIEDINDVRSNMINIEDPLDTLSRENLALIHEAIQRAITKSSKEINTFIEKNLPLTFQVHSIATYHKRKGWPTVLKINAGSIANLKAGDKLEVYRKEEDDSKEKILTELIVQEVEGPHFSLCKISKSNEAVGKIIEAHLKELSLHTTSKNSPVAAGMSLLKAQK